MRNATSKGRRDGAKRGTSVRRSSRLTSGEPASSIAGTSSIDAPSTSAAAAMAQLVSPTSAKATARRTKRKTATSASTSSLASALASASTMAAFSASTSHHHQDRAMQAVGTAGTVTRPSVPSAKRTSKRRKSSSSSSSGTTKTTATGTVAADMRCTARSRQQQQHGRQGQQQRGRQQRCNEQLHVTPSPVGLVPVGICASSVAVASAPAPSSPASDQSPIEGAAVKEALHAESERGDMMTPSSPDGYHNIKQEEEGGQDDACPPEGVVDLDALAFHHLTLRTDPHPYLPAEPYYVDTTNSFLAQYGRDYHKHLVDNALRHHRQLSAAQSDAPATPKNAIVAPATPKNAVVSSGASITSHGSGGSDASDAVLPHQSEITTLMRSILVDWLAELKHSFKLNDITLHLSVKLMDRVLVVWDLERKMFQCLGCACMLVASKLEETQPVTIKDLAYMTDGTYTADQIKEMEAKICDLLEFHLQSPTPYQFIDRFLRASDTTAGLHTPSPRNPIKEQMVLYLTELSLMKSEFIETTCCLVAAAAVYLARVTLGIQDIDGKIWNKTLEYYTGYSVRDLEHTVRILHAAQRDVRESDLQCCVEPYRKKERYCVATKPAVQPCDLGFGRYE